VQGPAIGRLEERMACAGRLVGEAELGALAEEHCDEDLVRWLVFMPTDDEWAERLAIASRRELEWTLGELRGRPLVVGKIRRVEARLGRSRGRRDARSALTKSDS
jgi:hypothetical protein